MNCCWLQIMELDGSVDDKLHVKNLRDIRASVKQNLMNEIWKNVEFPLSVFTYSLRK